MSPGRILCGMLDLDITFDEEPLAADAAPVLFAFDRSFRERDVDGRLHVENCNISKANVCPYMGSEIPNAKELGLDPNTVYQLYRDAAELEASAPSYERVPLMMKHIAVSADAPQKYFVVGTISNVRYRHPYLVADLTVWDAEAIRLIESGAQRELSCGYRYVCDVSPGTVDGVQFHARMRNIVANHVALVELGRAGSDVTVHDELPQELSHMKIATLVAALAPFLATDAKPEDVTAGISALLATDKKAKDEKEAKEAEDKAAADKAAKDAKVEGEDEDLDVDAEDEEAEEAKKKAAADKAAKDKKPEAMDAAGVATLVADAIAANDALHVARREVEPILGVVAYDSADKVYKAALDKLDISTDGIHVTAYPTLLKMAKDKAAAPALANDGAGKIHSMSEAFPGFDRIRR